MRNRVGGLPLASPARECAKSLCCSHSALSMAAKNHHAPKRTKESGKLTN